MKHSILLLAWAALAPLSLAAQDTYTERLQNQPKSRGRVTLHQSKAITDMVNGLAKAGQKPSAPAEGQAIGQAPAEPEAEAASAVRTGQRVRGNGYRIQVFSGGNSRQAKTEASAMGAAVKSILGDIPVYTQFISPHWNCRVGDFRTLEEANEVFNQLKETQRFPEAVIVKSKVNLYY